MTGTALGNTLSNEHAAYMNDSATRIPSVGLNCGTPRTAIDSNEDLASSRQEHPAQEMRSALVGSSPARPEAIERPVSLLSGLSCLSGEKDTSKHDVEREGCSPAVPPIVRQGSDCRKQPERMIRECLVSEKQGRGTNGLRTQIVRAGEQHRPVAYASSDIEMDTNEQEERTVQILVYLATLSPIFTLFCSLYSILVLLVLLITSPIHLCTNSDAFLSRASNLLAAPINYQLELIHSRTHSRTRTTKPRLIQLLPICIFSPVYAGFIALSSWVAGVFWLFSAILGDPDGSSRRDDGKAAVWGVIRWWEMWLVRGFS
ncbi:hypothetical protein MMC09_005155 [Bachmanniomyces sp. S44760]|nr:hypothetical protein [Bachmanniomyces sp. S44760]